MQYGAYSNLRNANLNKRNTLKKMVYYATLRPSPGIKEKQGAAGVPRLVLSCMGFRN